MGETVNGVCTEKVSQIISLLSDQKREETRKTNLIDVVSKVYGKIRFIVGF